VLACDRLILHPENLIVCLNITHKICAAEVKAPFGHKEEDEISVEREEIVIRG
jgi:hypothetical protein